jgi:hypothetical protein
MNREKLEIIKGYNEEKKILTERLSELDDLKNIVLRGSIEKRLREIDKIIKEEFHEKIEYCQYDWKT